MRLELSRPLYQSIALQHRLDYMMSIKLDNNCMTPERKHFSLIPTGSEEHEVLLVGKGHEEYVRLVISSNKSGMEIALDFQENCYKIRDF